MANPDMLLTRAGLNVLAQGLTGERIIFTRVAIGDGRFDYDAESVLDVTEMRNWRKDLPIVKCEVIGNGMVNLVAYETNSDVPEGFWEREHAIFAQDPKTGEEILYSYRNFGDECSFIPSNTGSILKDILVGFETVIQNAANVEAILDLNFAYVSQIDYEDHVKSEHPHPNTPNHYLNVSDTNKLWAVDEDNHLHQIGIGNARQVILGDAAKLIPSMGKIISDSQAKIDELDVFTQAKNELGLDANLMVVEDFKPATEIDYFKVKVMSCARGGRLIGVASDEGILKGAVYWIADGVNQELVKIKSVTYSTDYYHVTLEEALTHDYNLDAVYLYRTTYSELGTIDKKALNWTPPKSFVGIQANIGRTLDFDTSHENRNALIVEGEGLLTVDGYFTLSQDTGTLEYNAPVTDESSGTPSSGTSSSETVSGGDSSGGGCDCDCDCNKNDGD